MQNFKDLNDQIVYTNVNSRSEAMDLKNDAKETVASGKTVVIFFENRYHIHLAPGQDPYQIRKDIIVWMDHPNKSPAVKTAATITKTRPSRSKLKA